MKTWIMAVVVSGALTMLADSSSAQNLLTNGNFESASTVPEFLNWTAIEENVDQPSIAVDSVGREPFADRAAPPEVAAMQGLWLKPWVGTTCCGVDPNPPWETNYASNGKITQAVPAVVGNTYTFSGWSRFESNYSGGVDFLDPTSPLRGGQPSPTETIMSIEFLDSLGAVIGSPTIFDVRADREAQIGGPFANDFVWYQHSFSSPAAPANAANVRVTAAMLNGVFNVDGGSGQSARMDDFSLMRSGAAGELLMNGHLNDSPPAPPELQGYTLVEVGSGVSQDTAGRGGNFADNPNTPGDFGYWVKGFNAGDSTLTQIVPGVGDGDYTFDLWAAFGQNYSGGTGPAKPNTITKVELAFLDDQQMVIGTPLALDLWDEGLRNATGGISVTPQAWENFSLNGTSPSNTEFVRVGIIVTGAVNTSGPDRGAFFDDLELTLATAGLEGDHNQDGMVDAADYVLWRKNPAAFGGATGYEVWKENFGESSPGSGGGAVPEPATWLSVFAALALTGVARRAAR